MSVLTNYDAEAQLLGLYLTVVDALVRYPVTPAYFADPTHRAVFEAIGRLALRGEAADAVTVQAELRAAGVEATSVYLAELALAANLNGAGLVRVLGDCMRRRAMQRIGTLLAQSATDAELDPLDASDRCLELLAQETRTVGAADAPFADSLERAWLVALEAGTAAVPTITTGWRDLDGLLGGLPRGELSVIAARPGVGKSAFVGQLAAAVADQGRHVLFASAEMTAQQLLERWKASMLAVDLWCVRQGRLTETQWTLAKAMRAPHVRVFDRAGMTTQHIVDVCGRVANRQALDLLIVDHLHHLSDPLERGEQRYAQIGRMVNRLKALAKQHQMAVALVCQLNRQAADGVPTMAQLRDAGTIEEYANIVALLHQAPERPGTADVCVEKHRNGPTGKVTLTWEPQFCRFRNYIARTEAA